MNEHNKPDAPARILHWTPPSGFLKPGIVEGPQIECERLENPENPKPLEFQESRNTSFGMRTHQNISDLHFASAGAL